MPNLAAYHPQIVHFVVSLLFLGVALRLISIIGRPRFVHPTAATLLLIGTCAAVFAVKSGTDAHGPVERIPGTRALVIEHEELGQHARNFFLGVAVLELIGLGLSTRDTRRRYLRVAQIASALVGVVGSVQLYEAAEHGGELVYSYAGGPGLRTGNPRDVERLLLAGLYNQSVADRKAGRHAEAASLINEMARRFSADTTVRFLHAESLLLDTKDPAAAITALDSISLAPTDARFGTRRATLKADAYVALGRPDSARAVLTAAIASFPQSARLKAELDSIK